MRNDQTVTVRRADYRPPDFLLDHVALEFDLDPKLTYVTATLDVRRNPVVGGAAPLRLDGEDLDLALIAVDGHALPVSAYQVRDDGLTLRLRTQSNRFQLRTVVRIDPSKNTELMGLFVSNGNFFTQCEAEGFRRITFFPDRPDVMTTYRVTIRADKSRYPVLLANGNLIEQGDLSEGRHFAIWDDPFAKPSYLFALFAGDVAMHEDHFTRASGRDATLQIYVEHGDEDKTQHAMASLKRAIEWDERRYGLELDLDRFMIVASNDFNMGAMENKGLNIFNAKYILASPAVATDDDYMNVESIVGHEYFHNWTGNRVTCRDWFQLSLKEGLTVFRDQEFSADMLGDATSRAVKRIEDVRTLRASQFPEDGGPMAHPVRPDSYQEISNFYTATVYEKGAEVVRMLQTLVGVDGFRRGMDLYFKRHDGQAVTCDDFVAAIADANGRDLTQFKRWYSQAGTPHVRVEARYDPHAYALELTLSQTTPATAGQSSAQPFHIPFAMGLIAGDGRDMSLQLEGEQSSPDVTSKVLELTQARQTFRFVNVGERPVLSLLRNFSAPVILEHRYSDAELMFLSAHDSDAFNRWEAGQRLAIAMLMSLTDAVEAGRASSVDDSVVAMLRATLLDPSLSPAFKAQALLLPAESFIGEQRDVVDPEAIRKARRYAMREIGQRLAADWQATYSSLQGLLQTSAEYSPDVASAGRRALRNLSLTYLAEGDAEGVLEIAREQLVASTNITDAQGALAVIVNSASPLKAEALIQLARVWGDQPLLMNKWFQLQATAMAHPDEPPVVDRVRLLMRHPGFSLSNPNNVNALIRSFCMLNDAEFHRRDGSGYTFWVAQVLALDKINPTIAARIARALDRWRKFTPDRQAAMRAALEQIAALHGLSRDVCEIVNKSLAS